MSRLAFFFLMIVAPALSIGLALLGLETLGGNITGWFLLLVGIAFPAGLVIDTFIRRDFYQASTTTRVVREEKYDLSFFLILPGFLMVFFAPPLEWIYLPAVLPRLVFMQTVGMALILVAAMLRIWVRLHIRGLYTGHVQVRADHRLVQNGPYRFIRHPGYLGYVLIGLGVVISYASWIGLAALLFMLLPGLAYRMRVEERLLTEQFGEEYINYTKKTRKLIPWIW